MVLGLLCLELVYVLSANLALSTRLVRAIVQTAAGVKLEYDSAYSLIPGHVRVRGVRLRVEDANIQLQLLVPRASLTLSLHELALRRLHVLAVNCDGVSFRLRHKVHEVGMNGARLAAYAPIEGFAEPPLYDPTPPAPDPKVKYWEVHIDNVVAQLRELWILEYRFLGDAEARGSFTLRPTTWVQVEPAQLTLRSGSLHAGPHLAAKSITGTIQASVPGLDVKGTSGLQVFSGISGRIELALSGGSLGFLNLYTKPQFNFTLAGPSNFLVRVLLKRGLLAEGTKVQLVAPSYQAHMSRFQLAGGLHATFARSASSKELALQLEATDAKLTAAGIPNTPPQLRSVAGTMNLRGVDLTGSFEVAEATLSSDAAVPDLSWFDRLTTGNARPRLGGAGDCQLELQRHADGKGTGQLQLRLQRARLDYAGGQLRTSGRGTARFRTEERPVVFAQGALSLQLTDADSLLSFAFGSFLQSAVGKTLKLDALSANIAFHASAKAVHLQLTRAVSGLVTGRGTYYQPAAGNGRGAGLMTAGPVNVGILVKDGDATVSPLVSSDWLKLNSPP